MPQKRVTSLKIIFGLEICMLWLINSNRQDGGIKKTSNDFWDFQKNIANRQGLAAFKLDTNSINVVVWVQNFRTRCIWFTSLCWYFLGLIFSSLHMNAEPIIYSAFFGAIFLLMGLDHFFSLADSSSKRNALEWLMKHLCGCFEPQSFSWSVI